MCYTQHIVGRYLGCGFATTALRQPLVDLNHHQLRQYALLVAHLPRLPASGRGSRTAFNPWGTYWWLRTFPSSWRKLQLMQLLASGIFSESYYTLLRAFNLLLMHPVKTGRSVHRRLLGRTISRPGNLPRVYMLLMRSSPEVIKPSGHIADYLYRLQRAVPHGRMW